MEIADIIFEKIKDIMNMRSVMKNTDLIKYGNEILKNEILKSNSKVDIWYPLNICVNNYYENQIGEFDINIKDVIKVDLGLDVNECRYRITKVICKEDEKIENALNTKIFKKVIKLKDEYLLNSESKNYINLNDNEPLTTDIIRIIIENELLKYNLEAIPNCISRCNEKWMYLNYSKNYDLNEYLIGDPNYCFDISEGDIWCFNIICYKTGTVFKEKNTKTNIYNFTENRHQLKSQLSKKFYSEYKKKYCNKVFTLKECNSKDIFALTELLKYNLIINNETKFDKNNNKIYIARFNLKF